MFLPQSKDHEVKRQLYLCRDASPECGWLFVSRDELSSGGKKEEKRSGHGDRKWKDGGVFRLYRAKLLVETKNYRKFKGTFKSFLSWSCGNLSLFGRLS